MSTDTPPLAATTDDRAIAIRRYRQGECPSEIAADLEADLETITAALRRHTDLPPWDDHRALAHLFHDCGYASTSELSDLFDGARSAEVIRERMERFGIDRNQTSMDLLEELNPEDVGLSPLSETDDRPTPDEGGQQTLDSFGGGSV